ncbi:N-acyl homoserine lactonase family protein [Pseudonocardia kujensis]|uniref:N-acyl homoserine lactonase family protein n=1 Tax=Pseudonocardia kujensis TaxID=1128675 RepID=UPI001E355916|nr:N-acyl homoserine lactonase family protein [Pseudonocardia kujensis]MCE0762689.1 N-acyl homoserine lactonase family protein [Pseudonocardia kujensis]
MATANKLSIIPCGAMHADLTFLLLKPGVSIMPRGQKDSPISWVEVPTHCVLVETDEGKVLWDTSCPSDWETRWKPTGLQEFFPYDKVADDEYLDAQLNKMGVGLDEIDYVVLSHLHFDHAGNAQMFKNTNAKLICSDKEKDFALNFEGDFNGAHLKADYEGLNWETVSGDTELLPGVKLIQAPGHTVGCMSMQVDLPDSGTMIFTSDAVYMGESYGPPAAPAAIVNNLEQWFQSVEKLRGIQEKTNATMVFGHDAQQIHELRKAPEGSYT